MTDVDTITTDLIRATSLLIRRTRATQPHELSIPQAQAMARLAETGPMTTADLARAEAVKPQSMGATLAALEDDGLVSRQPHPTDGRQVLFALTPKSTATRDANKRAKRQWLGDAIGTLDPAERETLAAATKLLWRIANT